MEAAGCTHARQRGEHALHRVIEAVVRRASRALWSEAFRSSEALAHRGAREAPTAGLGERGECACSDIDSSWVSMRS
jgi:hypothetical protein